jgi:nucleoside-diphosphate-sugar epimerase
MPSLHETSVLLISAEDTDAARLLTRALLERGSTVAALSPVPFPQDSFPGVRLIDARELHDGQLEAWFRERPHAAVIDLGAFRPESIELLRRLHVADIDHYIFCSTTEVYAAGAELPHGEGSPLGDAPAELVAVERYLETLRAEGSLPVTAVRCSPLYGEGRGALAYLFDRILFGDGVLCPRPLEDALQPLYVGDWIECLLGLLRHPAAPGEVFNLVGAEWTTLGELLQHAAAAAYTGLRAFAYAPAEVEADLLAELDPFPFPGSGHQLCSGLKLLELCALEPATPLATGLEQGFIRYLEQAGEIGEPRLHAERRVLEALRIETQAAGPAAEALAPEALIEPSPRRPTAGSLGAPTKLGMMPQAPGPAAGAGRMGAPTRLGPGASMGPLRRPRQPGERPPPPAVSEVVDRRLDSMVDLMLSGVNREGENELQLEMKDEILGGLHIKISQARRRVRASFGCRQRDSRAKIESNFPELRRKLESRGYFVTELVATVVL